MRNPPLAMTTTKRVLTLYAYALANGWKDTEASLRASYATLERG